MERSRKRLRGITTRALVAGLGMTASTTIIYMDDDVTGVNDASSEDECRHLPPGCPGCGRAFG